MALRTSLLVLMMFGFAAPKAWSQDSHAAHTDSVAFFLPKPKGWGTEEFPLPPVFAQGFSYKGVEDIRFAPGWGKKDSEQYWSYAYLWWLEGGPVVDAPTLQRNLEAYYTGLVAVNGAARIPKENLTAARASIRKTRTAAGDAQTYLGTVSMLDYMTVKPIVLNVTVRVKDCKPDAHTALFVEVSPQGFSHPVWTELDALGKGLRCGR